MSPSGYSPHALPLVIPDIFYRESILVFRRWIPAPANSYRGKLYNCGYDGLGKDTLPR